MKEISFAGRLVAFIGLFVLVGCAHVQASESERMLSLGAAITKLSFAVEDTVKYGELPKGSGDAELLARATRHDPSLLEPFKDYTLKVLVQDNSAIVLVCTKDGKTALLEDAACSTKMDKHLWKEDPSKECEFTLSVREACPSL